MELDQFAEMQAERDKHREEMQSQQRKSDREYHDQQYGTVIGTLEDLTKEQEQTSSLVAHQDRRLTTVETKIEERSQQVGVEIRDLKTAQGTTEERAAKNSTDIAGVKTTADRNTTSITDAHQRINKVAKAVGVDGSEGWSTKQKVGAGVGGGATVLAIIAGTITKLLEVW